MNSMKISENIHWVGVNDRTTDLFEGLWPIDGCGISYNAYVINDKKKVLVDLAKSFKTDDFLDQISRIIPPSQLDAVVINHMEPDHTGVVRTLRMIAPHIEILCSPKAVGMLRDYYGITEGIRAVGDGDTYDTGDRVLSFHHIPFVHWPETMVTYDKLTGTLFACDAFGGYGALQGSLFDDTCGDIAWYEKESLRYYANIVAKFSTPVLNAIRKLESVDVRCIAPSHGLIWRKNPARIVELYRAWAGLGASGGKGITIIYGTMYGNTETMMNAVAEGVSSEGMTPEIFDVARTHASYILPALLANDGVVIGAPTYEASLFPYMQSVLDKAVLKNIKNRKAAYFGSYGWSRGALKKVQEIVSPAGWQMQGEIEFAGAATADVLRNGYELGRSLAQAVKG